MLQLLPFGVTWLDKPAGQGHQQVHATGAFSMEEVRLVTSTSTWVELNSSELQEVESLLALSGKQTS